MGTLTEPEEALRGRRRCRICMLVLSTVMSVLGLVITLVTRIYLMAFYVTAHLSAMTVIVGVFVWTHQTARLHLRLSMDFSRFLSMQFAFNMTYFLCSLIMAGLYTAVAVLTGNFNLDFILASVFAFYNVIVLLYLLCLTSSACGKQGEETSQYHFAQRQPSWLGRRKRFQDTARNMWQQQTIPLKEPLAASEDESPDRPSTHSHHSSDSKLDKTSKDKKGRCRRCCRVFFRVLYGIIHSILIIIFVLSAYQACFVLFDTWTYRSDSVTLTTPGHLPLSVYIKCEGTGTQTILFEGGLGGTVFTYWDFIPKSLANNPRYRVCSYDRRGYGWSDGLESDVPWSQMAHPQRYDSNVDFLLDIIKAYNISTPFIYIGHGYGGSHLTYMAIKYPHLVKALIYLDSSEFVNTSLTSSYHEAIANILSSGVMRLVQHLGIVRLEEKLIDGTDLELVVSEETRDQLVASLHSGFYFSSYVRELYYHASALPSTPATLTIDKPVYVLDPETRNDQEWFPQDVFPLYNNQNHVTVPGSTPQSLVLSATHANGTAYFIDLWIMSLLDKENM